MPGKNLKLGHDCFLPYHFQFHHSLVIIPFHTIYSKLLTVSLNKNIASNDKMSVNDELGVILTNKFSGNRTLKFNTTNTEIHY
jgi:hypothetical protein